MFRVPRVAALLTLASLLVVAGAASPHTGLSADSQATPAPSAATAPPARSTGSPLMAYATPSDAGFSAAKLDDARAFADKNRAAAVVALYRGHVIAAWGAVDRNLMAHSVRKSLAGALYGIAEADKQLSLDATLADLGVEDAPPLSASEKQARVRDLVAARSGVYHAAAYADAGQTAGRPARDSHAPGTFWFYNNWDFNAAEAIYQRATGQDLYAAFDEKVARPIGMEDFHAADQLRVLEPSQSRFPAHTFRISARDLARFGQLYLQEGRWKDRQVVPREWVRESLRAHSKTGDGTGYGYLWWIYDAGALGASYPTLDRGPVYLARGTGGQTIFLIPSAEMVVVHRADTDNGRSVSGPLIWQLVERLAAAREGQPAANPALRPMSATPLGSALPPPPAPRFVTLAAGALSRLAGDYAMTSGGVLRVFLHDGRLFLNVPGLGEAEVFALSPLEFTLKAEAGVSIVFREDQPGAVTGLRIAMGRTTIEAVRR
jgi:CubicO group peptidase (beta-lactamase class C family)